ncbi:MAG: polysaccharide deacetylase family protein [Selenomonadaceae bacterium]|nr:polysaccharide deacetylase family protein [Selenomonadaceae bacterium]MBQ2410771.1 polysaccharide deacetylase family protein [Selenomonadaceae bacterium]MBQ5585836.1 polysaccharide deacetylase family protein [Selenomonadaceae bacterium]MBQ5733319.1 polysaccharide deacetylase family protein [Selenomonadaceae bacterium]MBQ5845324.1 polysaccharide deacetylase family protein [Selenomonadaceae bacterium]
MAVQLQPEKQEAAAMPVAQVTVQDDPRTVMVLNYHKVVDEHMSLSVPLADFEQHMKWLKEYGYTSITPEELYEFIVNGSELPEKPVLITFDDGYKDNYTNAYPIMKKYGFKGTIFVVTGFLGVYDNYMTWEQAKELSDNGFSIESHTYSHKSMTEASDEEISKELTKSRDTIRNKLGIEADFMAYPTGTYNLHIAELVQKAGYKGAFTIKYDNVSRESNVYALERVPIFHTENTNKDFLERIQYLPLLYKYGWVKN